MNQSEVLRLASKVVKNSAEAAIIKVAGTKQERIRALVVLQRVREDPDLHHSRMVEDLELAVALAAEEK